MERGRIEITPSHITGLIAVTVSIYFLIMHRADLSIVAASVFFTLACTTDTFKSKIPNLLNACLLVAGITINTMTTGMHGFLLSLSGLALGIALLLLPYIMRGMGAGDVKAFGALGALMGHEDPCPEQRMVLLLRIEGGTRGIGEAFGRVLGGITA